MKIDELHEHGIIFEFVYSPLYEMFCALHVLTNAEHHLHRKPWAEKIIGSLDIDFFNEIIGVGEITNNYLIIMDVCNKFEECSELSILASIEFLEKLPLRIIQDIYSYYKMNISILEFERILKLLKRFYIDVFSGVLHYIEPLIVRLLRNKVQLAKEKGTIFLINSIHERICVMEDEIVLYKYKEFRYKMKNLKKIYLHLSTFISPHLMLGIEEDMLFLTFLVELQKTNEFVPLDLENRFKALGDATRLRILKEIGDSGKSTQELSKILEISEAAVSKALKILSESNLVYKKRKGNYIIYSINRQQIDYLPYNLYEFFM